MGRVRAVVHERRALMFAPENVALMRPEALATLDALERARSARAEAQGNLGVAGANPPQVGAPLETA
jgi:hypothetical protein